MRGACVDADTLPLDAARRGGMVGDGRSKGGFANVTGTARRPTVEEWRLIGRHFDRLCDRPHDEQQTEVARSGLDPMLADHLARLLAAHADNGILDARPDTDAGEVEADAPCLAPGSMVGRFRVVRLIGRGGAGEVYLAERSGHGFTQRVALKLLRADAIPHMAAFDRERALVATIDHPGIARLVDGGAAPDGRPYMALDYVEGEPITHWCAAQDADLDRRLALFLEVCDAVAHAHARLIVHHDIKPANILIDQAGRSRLLDFGIARAIEEGAAPGREGAMLTPGYAAPEQLAGEPTTVVTDVYALGALLFELLTGRPPWRTGGSFLPTILRRMSDELPSVPSQVAALGNDAPVTARRLTGDLDAIVLKAMQADPEARYASVTALADDIRRYRRHEPISVRAGSVRYHFLRFVQRNRWAVAAATIAVLAMIAGAAAVAWQARRIAIERDAVRDQAERLEASNQALLLMFRDASDAAQMQTLTVAQMVDGTTQRMIRSLPPDSPDAASTIAALADIYLITGNNAYAETLLSGALARGIGRATPADGARLKLKLATVLALQGRFDRAEPMGEVERVWRGDPDRYRRERVETIGARAVIAKMRGQLNAAIGLLTDNMPDAERVYIADDRDLAARVASLASLLADTGRLDQAAAVVAHERRRMADAGQPPSNPSLNLLRQSADIANRQGRPELSLAALRETVEQRRAHHGPSIGLAVDLLHLARLLNQLGRPGDALPLLAESEPMGAEHFGAQSQPVIQIRVARVEALARMGRTADARAIFATIAPPAGRMAAPDANLVRYLRCQALLLWAEGNRAAAQTLFAEVRAMIASLGRSADGVRIETASALRLVGQPD